MVVGMNKFVLENDDHKVKARIIDNASVHASQVYCRAFPHQTWRI